MDESFSHNDDRVSRSWSAVLFALGGAGVGGGVGLVANFTSRDADALWWVAGCTFLGTTWGVLLHFTRSFGGGETLLGRLRWAATGSVAWGTTLLAWPMEGESLLVSVVVGLLAGATIGYGFGSMAIAPEERAAAYREPLRPIHLLLLVLFVLVLLFVAIRGATAA